MRVGLILFIIVKGDNCRKRRSEEVGTSIGISLDAIIENDIELATTLYQDNFYSDEVIPSNIQTFLLDYKITKSTIITLRKTLSLTFRVGKAPIMVTMTHYDLL